MQPATISLEAMLDRYCERQDSTPHALYATLVGLADKFKPDGFAMFECQVLDSNSLGNLWILPIGPNNTFKAVPAHPVSLRGLASDMSVAVAWLPVDDFPRTFTGLGPFQLKFFTAGDAIALCSGEEARVLAAYDTGAFRVKTDTQKPAGKDEARWDGARLVFAKDASKAGEIAKAVDKANEAEAQLRKASGPRRRQRR